MEYRKLPHGEEMISVIGMGSSVVGEQKEADIIRTVEYAWMQESIILTWQEDMRRSFRLTAK